MWQQWIRLVMTVMLLLMLIPVSARFHSERVINPEPTDAAVELDKDSFNQTLASQTTPFAVVEFFANWCPACRNYKPHYERIARLFNGVGAPHRGFVFMAKVDCALPINRGLCDRYNIKQYPTMMWGPPQELVLGPIGAEIVQIEGARNADQLLQWINKRTGRDYALDVSPSPAGKSSEGHYVQVAVQVHDIEQATIKAYELILDNHMLNLQSRGAFINFLQLLVLHHPSERCRIGSSEILWSLEKLWPSSVNETGAGGPVAHYDAFREKQICGITPNRGQWRTCKGSRPDTRGYSCGLWLLFHSLSVRVDDVESEHTLKSIQNFIFHFFNCEECRAHFLQLASNMGPVSSQKELVLWLWRAHNEVNERLMTELSGSGDPEFPKVMWPPKHACDSCSTTVVVLDEEEAQGKQEWNETAVVSYMSDIYSRLLVPSPTDPLLKGYIKREQSDMDESSGSSVSVPIGAAIGIALASCGFGVAACVWRMHQKRRKSWYWFDGLLTAEGKRRMAKLV